MPAACAQHAPCDAGGALDAHARLARRAHAARPHPPRSQRFFCDGFCMVGPNWKSCIGTMALLVVPTVLFLVFVVPYMSERKSWAILAIRWGLMAGAA